MSMLPSGHPDIQDKSDDLQHLHHDSEWTSKWRKQRSWKWSPTTQSAISLCSCNWLVSEISKRRTCTEYEYSMSRHLISWRNVHGRVCCQAVILTFKTNQMTYNTCIVTRNEHSSEENKDHENDHQQLKNQSTSITNKLGSRAVVYIPWK